MSHLLLEQPFGIRLKNLRQNKNLTQADLARGICSVSSVCQYETGRIKPSYDVLCKLSERLGVSVSHLYPENSVGDFDFRMKQIQTLLEIRDYGQAFELSSAYDYDGLLAEHVFLICSARFWNYLLVDHDPDRAEEEINIVLNIGRVNPITRGKLFLLQGHCYRERNDWVSAYVFYTKAHDFCLNVDMHGFTYAEVCYFLGISCRMIGKRDEAHSHLNRALIYFNNSQDIRRRANTLYEMAISKADVALMDEARLIYEMLNEKDMVLICRQWWASNSLAAEDYKDACAVLCDIAAEYERLNDVDRILYNLAWALEISVKENDVDLSSGIAMGILEHVDKIGDITLRVLSFCKRVIGEYYLMLRKYDLSKRFLLDSAELYLQIGITQDAMKAFRNAICCCRGLGLIDEALDIMDRVLELETR